VLTGYSAKRCWFTYVTLFTCVLKIAGSGEWYSVWGTEMDKISKDRTTQIAGA
jgi:hypothetical protein